MTGAFLKELEEDIHHEEWINFWRRRGPLIASLVLITLLGTGGYLWWHSHKQTQMEQESVRYEKAVTALNLQGPNSEAEAIFKELAAKSDKGYGLLSRLQLLRLYSLKRKGDSEILQTLLKEKEGLIRLAQKDRNLGVEGCVSLSLAHLCLDSLTTSTESDGILNELKQYETPQNPWKGLSLELQGLYLLKQKNSNAPAFYKTLLTTPDISQAVRLRGSMEAIAEGFALPLRHEN